MGNGRALPGENTTREQLFRTVQDLQPLLAGTGGGVVGALPPALRPVNAFSPGGAAAGLLANLGGGQVRDLLGMGQPEGREGQAPLGGGTDVDPVLAQLASFAPGGMPGGPGGFDKKVTTTEQRTPALLSPEEVGARTGQIQQRQGQLVDIADQQLGAVEAEQDAIGGLVLDLQLERSRLGRDQAQRKLELQRAEKAVTQARAAFDKAGIDPNRYAQNLPTSQRVMTVVAGALGGFMEGFSRGQIQNDVPRLINQAINRDLEAQRINLQKQFRALGITAGERDRILDTYDQGESERRKLALQAGKLKLAEVAAQAKAPEVRMDLLKQMAVLDEQVMQAELAGKERKTISTVTRKVPVGGAVPAQLDLDKNDAAQLAASHSIVPELLDYVRQVQSVQEGKHGIGATGKVLRGKIPGTREHAVLKGLREKKAVVMAVAMSGAQFRQAEFETFLANLAGGFDRPAIQAQKVNNFLAEAVTKHGAKAKAFMQQGKLPEARAFAQRAIVLRQQMPAISEAIATGQLNEFKGQ
jgi:DNA-binding transcriptional MerR regulator